MNKRNKYYLVRITIATADKQKSGKLIFTFFFFKWKNWFVNFASYFVRLSNFILNKIIFFSSVKTLTMHSTVKYIVRELNRPPFNNTFNIVSFDSLSSEDLLQVIFITYSFFSSIESIFISCLSTCIGDQFNFSLIILLGNGLKI